MDNHKKKIPVISIVLYAIAGMLLLYTIWALNHSMSYISELVGTGQLMFKGNEFDIVSFYMSSSAQYALFAVILFSLGWILQNISSHKSVRLNEESNRPSFSEAPVNGDDEDNFEDWIQSNNQ